MYEVIYKWDLEFTVFFCEESLCGHPVYSSLEKGCHIWFNFKIIWNDIGTIQYWKFWDIQFRQMAELKTDFTLEF